MKHLIYSFVCLPALLHAEVIEIDGKKYENKAGDLGKKVNIVPFRDNLSVPWNENFGYDHPYSSALGFALWKSSNTHLGEISVTPMLTRAEYLKDIKENLPAYIGQENYDALDKDGRDKRAEELADKVYAVEVTQDGVKTYDADEIKERQLTTRLGIFDENGIENGSAVLFSIRNSFSYYNLNQEGFAFDYTNTDGKGSMKVKGALMADIYLHSLYNHRWYEDPPFIVNPYRVSFRTGVEFDQDDTATVPTDRTSFYMLANFQANPDQNAHLLGIDNFWQITSPQFIQVGAALDHDDFTGEDDLRWILSWQPRLYVVKDWTVIGQNFGINHIMRYKKDGRLFEFAKDRQLTDDNQQKTTPSDQRDEFSPWYSYIPADIKLTGGSEIWDRLAKGKEDLDEAALQWQLGLIFGNSDYRFRFGYKAEGVSPASNIGDSSIGHSLFAEIGLGNISDAYATEQRKDKGKGKSEMTGLTDADLGVVTVFAKYSFGEFEPTFENQELFQIGTRVRF